MTEIGQILRSSTEGFTCGTRGHSVEAEFGQFVRTESRNVETNIITVGVVSAIRVDDDPLVRQLIMANNLESYPAAIRDQRENRMIPIEIDVISVGFADGSGFVHHSLPPRPPFSLDPVTICEPDEIRAFTETIDFVRLILNAHGVASHPELLAAVLRNASEFRPEGERNAFLIGAGRQVTSLLNHDMHALNHVLSLLKSQINM